MGDPRQPLLQSQHRQRQKHRVSNVDPPKKHEPNKKLATYREKSTRLRTDCEALQSQLVLTAQRLQEVDSRAALKVDTLQSELRETSAGMEVLATHKAQESVEQSACVKSMGKRLIKQSHVT